MTEERVESRHADKMQPLTLQEGVEMLRARLSSVRLETLEVESDTALNVRFLGDVANLEERQLLVKNLARYLPPTLSIIGVKTDPEPGAENNGDSNAAP
jgi:hypothetical protein